METYYFIVGSKENPVSGHSCYWCHRWIKTGELARYQSHGDCGQVYCEKCAKATER